LNQIGLGIDFREVKTAIGEIVQEFDHNNLNEFPAFQEENPSSENIARFLYRQLGRKLNSPGVRVSGVKISESPGQGVCYREEEDCESCL
jgi:6-pyruvoyltetrahydropterin/6-carboxytetrahydropterin synthase